MDVIQQQKRGWRLIKNPRSLNDIGASVRGIITKNGDLFIENFPLKIHHDILEILHNKNILKGELRKGWGRKMPGEFITVQRYKNSNTIALGESNSDLYKYDDWVSKIGKYTAILNKAILRNNNIKFSSKLIGTRSVLTDPNQINIIKNEF